MSYIDDLLKQNPVQIVVEIIVLIAACNWIFGEVKSFIKNSGIKFSWLEQKRKDHVDINALQKNTKDLEKRIEGLEDKNKASTHFGMETSKTIAELGNTMDGLKTDYEELKGGLRQLTSDRAGQRIRYFWSLGYIPDEEFDEFCDFLEYAIDVLKCNHGLDRKYKECKGTLPVLTVEQAIDFKLKREQKGEIKNGD